MIEKIGEIMMGIVVFAMFTFIVSGLGAMIYIIWKRLLAI